MTFHTTVAVSAMMALSLGAPAIAQEAAATEESATETPSNVTADTVVATVGGTEITVGHMMVARKTLPEQYLQLPPEVLWEGLLDQLIQQTALAQTLDGDISKETALALDNQRSGYIAGDVLQDVALDAVTDEALQAAYDEKFANAEPATEYNAAHILVETEEEAKAIKEEVEGGADFAEVAKEKSTGPSGPNGGALGWFSEGMMVPEFEAAVKELEPGAVSDPVQTQFGWHVIKLGETRAKETPTLETVKAELSEEIQRVAVDAAVEKAVGAAEVVKSEDEIPASVLLDASLLED